MDWKNQYCYNVYNTYNNLQIQFNPNQYSSILHWIRRNNSKIYMETPPKEKLKRQSFWSKMYKFWGNILPDFKIYYRVKTIKENDNGNEDRYIDKWNRIESLEINTYICRQLIFNTGIKKHAFEKGQSFKEMLANLNMHVRKNEIKLQSHFSYKDQLTLD
jgi:hypothetical protein